MIKNLCSRCKIGIDDDGDGHCATCARLTNIQVQLLRDAATVDPIFEIVEADYGIYDVNCWFQAPDGIVYRNRQQMPFYQLPFFEIPQVAKWAWLGDGYIRKRAADPRPQRCSGQPK